MKGVLVGAIGLLALHALVARANQDQLTGLVGIATTFVTRFLDPNIPAIPDHSANAATPIAGTNNLTTTPVTIGPAVLAPGLLSGVQKVSPIPAPTAR